MALFLCQEDCWQIFPKLSTIYRQPTHGLMAEYWPPDNQQSTNKLQVEFRQSTNGPLLVDRRPTYCLLKDYQQSGNR